MKKLLFLLVFFSQVVFAQEAVDSWSGTLEAGPQKLTIILKVDRANSTVMMEVPEQSVSVPMEVRHLSGDSICVLFPQLSISYQGRFQGEELRGRYQQGLFATDLNLNRALPAVNRPQEPHSPYPYQTKEVTFRDGDAATLAGTLCYPQGWEAGTRVPVVLFVTGSGPENRDQELFHHKPFLVMADWLARHGIASLRYDDRGCGSSTGDYTTATTFDFAKDAAAGIDYLRSLGQFSKVGLVGCSEGGGIGYILAADKKLDFFVSWCGPTCKIDTMMVQQVNGLAQSQGAPSGTVVKNVAEVRQLLLKQSDTPWMRCFLDLDLTPYVAKTTCPVLALFGGKDVNVPAEMNVASFKAHIPDNKYNQIKVYPGLNHLLQHCENGALTESYNIEETISPEVLQDVSTWINSLPH
jgi:pimeloyl-ACP methyl ester carboxylesterase